MKMALSVPLADVVAYRKVGKAFFGLLDVLCGAHTGVIAACDSATFAHLMAALDAGLKVRDCSWPLVAVACVRRVREPGCSARMRIADGCMTRDS